MDEKELFNRDSMFWREVNATSKDAIAEIHLTETIEISGEQTDVIHCTLLRFESQETVYDMENGGAFKKNEVKAWPYVLLTDLEFYNSEYELLEDRQTKVRSVSHDIVRSIILKDAKGQVLLKKAKVG